MHILGTIIHRSLSHSSLFLEYFNNGLTVITVIILPDFNIFSDDSSSLHYLESSSDDCVFYSTLATRSQPRNLNIVITRYFSIISTSGTLPCNHQHLNFQLIPSVIQPQKFFLPNGMHNAVILPASH